MATFRKVLKYPSPVDSGARDVLVVLKGTNDYSVGCFNIDSCVAEWQDTGEELTQEEVDVLIRVAPVGVAVEDLENWPDQQMCWMDWALDEVLADGDEDDDYPEPLYDDLRAESGKAE